MPIYIWKWKVDLLHAYVVKFSHFMLQLSSQLGLTFNTCTVALKSTITSSWGSSRNKHSKHCTINVTSWHTFCRVQKTTNNSLLLENCFPMHPCGNIPWFIRRILLQATNNAKFIHKQSQVCKVHILKSNIINFSNKTLAKMPFDVYRAPVRDHCMCVRTTLWTSLQFYCSLDNSSLLVYIIYPVWSTFNFCECKAEWAKII